MTAVVSMIKDQLAEGLPLELFFESINILYSLHRYDPLYLLRPTIYVYVYSMACDILTNNCKMVKNLYWKY